MMGLFHHNMWGSKGAGGAMQVNLTASIPLPSTEVNQNVLATETPSHAPAPPSPKEQQHIDEKAIPILGKQAKPKQQTTPKTQPHQPQPQQNVAASGEQSGSVIPHQMQPGAIGQTTVGDNNFATLYPWYVDQINRTMQQNWNNRQVDSRTPKGARVYMVFTIHRDGTLSNLQLDRSSGSPTLDRSCLIAAQRVSTFGNLPAAYNQSTLRVSYYCEY
jgi:protein TonB